LFYGLNSRLTSKCRRTLILIPRFVTIVSGSVGTRHGEKFEKIGELLKPGSLWVYPAKHAHYAWTGNEEGILQVQFIGPDPRKKTTQ
jgi:hypothetical protein